MTKYRLWFVAKIIDQIAAHGNRDTVMRLTWPTPKQLKYVEIVQYEWECPPARCLTLADYQKEHGIEGDAWREHMKQACL